MIISQRVSELLRGHEIMIDGRTDKVITIGPLPTSSGESLMNFDTGVDVILDIKLYKLAA